MSPVNKRRALTKAKAKISMVIKDEDEDWEPEVPQVKNKKHIIQKRLDIKSAPLTVDIIQIPEFPELKIKVVKRGKLPYSCNKCDIGFATKKLLDEHAPIHVLRKVKQPNKRFRCDICAKEFGKLCDIERHTRVHTGEKPSVCNICNKRFQQYHNLSKHLLTHLHVKPYHCEICNKQFGRNDVLTRHLLTHSLEKPIKCPLCSKGFIRHTQLNNHMKNHPDAARVGITTETKDEPDLVDPLELDSVDPLESDSVDPLESDLIDPN